MKVRKLQFGDGEAEQAKFAMIYRGFLEGGNRLQHGRGPKPIETYRTEARLLDKLEAISEQVEGTPIRMISGARELVLTEPEFDIVKSYFMATDWVVAVSREFVNTVDWLTGIPQEDATGG